MFAVAIGTAPDCADGNAQVGGDLLMGAVARGQSDDEQAALLVEVIGLAIIVLKMAGISHTRADADHDGGLQDGRSRALSL